MRNLTIEPPYAIPSYVRPIEKEVCGNNVAIFLEQARGYSNSRLMLHGIFFNGEIALIDDHHKAAALYLLGMPFELEILETDTEVQHYGKGAARHAPRTMDYLSKIISARFQDLAEPKFNVHQIGDMFVFLRTEDKFARAKNLTIDRVLGC